MIITLKNNLHWILFSLGFIFYCVLLAQAALSWSIVWLIFMIYTWLIISLILKQYVFKQFLYLLCSSGIWVSLTWFIIKGVEEVPLPKGAFLFKTEGIIPSIILFMLFTIPLIIHHFGSTQKIMTRLAGQEKQPQASNKNHNVNNWEEASIEDLESGDFEIS
tara:strand:- start:2356 stop:2841 length:486 start_codon:yes stop_codon:yes gene_type:complete